MDDLKSYLLRQTTDVLMAAAEQSNVDQESKMLLESILYQRQALLDKYSYNMLLDMTPKQLIELLNSPYIRSEDYIASKAIMLDVLNILDEKAPNADIYYSKELIVYLKDFV